NADPHTQWGADWAGELRHRTAERKPGAHGSLRIVLVRLWVAEIGEHALAREGRDRPAEAGDDLRTAPMVLCKQNAQILRTEPRRKGSRPDKTTRHDGQLATLSR